MWDGRFYSFTVCPAANPELHNELAELTPRARAERLRYLAGLGLFANRGIIKQTSQEQVPPPNTDSDADPGSNQPAAYTNKDRKSAVAGFLKSLS